MKRFAVAIALTIAVSVPAVAQKVISQIAAKVNKDIILASELKRAEEDIRTELTEQQKLKGPQLQQAMEARSKDILRDLIDKYLILAGSCRPGPGCQPGSAQTDRTAADR